MSRRPWGTNPRTDECIAPSRGREKHSVSGYSNADCRCPECREAWRLYRKELREAKRRGEAP